MCCSWFFLDILLRASEHSCGEGSRRFTYTTGVSPRHFLGQKLISFCRMFLSLLKSTECKLDSFALGLQHQHENTVCWVPGSYMEKTCHGRPSRNCSFIFSAFLKRGQFKQRKKLHYACVISIEVTGRDSKWGKNLQIQKLWHHGEGMCTWEGTGHQCHLKFYCFLFGGKQHLLEVQPSKESTGILIHWRPPPRWAFHINKVGFSCALNNLLIYLTGCISL